MRFIATWLIKMRETELWVWIWFLLSLLEFSSSRVRWHFHLRERDRDREGGSQFPPKFCNHSWGCWVLVLVIPNILMFLSLINHKCCEVDCKLSCRVKYNVVVAPWIYYFLSEVALAILREVVILPPSLATIADRLMRTRFLQPLMFQCFNF